MDIPQLEAFVAVAEAGSIHGGARRLLIAQPAVSKSIRKLERQLGAELLIRSTQGITLTSAGEVFLGQARDILDRCGRAIDAVRNTGRQRELTVGLVAGAVSAGELTSVILRRFRELRPDVTVTLRELDFPGQFSSVTQGQVDVAVVRPPCPNDDLAVTPLFEEPIALCCREDHRLAGKDQVEVSDILDQPMLDMADSPPAWKDFWLLSELRYASPSTEQSVRNLSELSLTLTCSNRTVMPLAGSAWRLGVPKSTSLRTVPLRNAPRSTAAIAAVRDDEREEVGDFIATAISTVNREIGAIPRAEPYV